MASAQIGALRVLLSMDAGEFSRGTKKAENELTDFGRTVTRISNHLNNVSFEFNSSMMAAQRFASVVRGIVTVASEFGSGMSAVSTLVDTNTESMQGMTQAVLEIGRRTPVALSELTTGLYDLRSAGSTADNAIERLERSAQLAVAGLGTTKEAVDLVTSSINSFGLQGAEADKVYDQIFKTIQAGKTTISGLAQGFGAVAGTVANAGIKLDEYLASIAALTVTGIPAAQAHTMIRAAIAGLTRESELGEKAMKAFGVTSFKELVEKSGGMVGALTNVRNAFGGNAQALIKLLGSVEAYGALVALTGQQNEAFNQTMVKMRDGSTAVGDAFDKRSQGMSAALQTMNNAISDLTIALGEALAPTIKAFSETIVGLADAFRSLDPETQQLIAQFATIAAVVVPATMAVAFFASGIGALIPVIGAIGAAITALVVATGPIGMLIAALGVVSAGWYAMQNVSQEVLDKVAAYVGVKITEMMNKLKEFGLFLSEMFGKIFSGDFTGAINMFGATTKGVFDEITLSGEGVVATYNSIDIAAQKAAANAYTYKGPVIAANDAETESLSRRNTAFREGLQLMDETYTPMEKLIQKQMEIQALWRQGAIDATTYGRAMAQASAFSAKNMDALASSVSSNLSTIFGDTKAVAIATALINTYQGVTKALATYPPPVAQIMAGIQLAAGLAQVANIRKQTKSGGGGGGGGGDTGAGAAAAAQMPQQLMVQGINPSQLYSGDAVKELAAKLIQFQKDGGQVVLQ